VTIEGRLKPAPTFDVTPSAVTTVRLKADTTYDVLTFVTAPTVTRSGADFELSTTPRSDVKDASSSV
jgi:hypothetical protein